MAVLRHLDVFVLIETKLRDATTLRAAADAEAIRCGLSLRFLSCSRPDSFTADGELNNPSGGILVVVLNPSLKISDYWDDRKGILSFSAKLPHTQRLALVCSYLPDAASPYSRWTADLIESCVAEIKRRRVDHGRFVFWLGDFNLRLGPDQWGRRASPDKRATNTPRVRQLRRALRILGMLPVHGRADHIPAVCTSKHIIPGQPGMSEVDYIMASTEFPPNVFTPIMAPSWGSAELPPDGTHIPLMISVVLPSDAGALEGQLPRRRKPWVLPPYSDKRWFEIRRRISRGIPRVQREINRPGATAETSYDALRSLFHNAAVAVCGTAAARRVLTFKHRLYSNAPLPSEIVTLFQLARSLRKRSNAARGLAKVHLRREADITKAEATRLADSFLVRFRDEVLANLQREMRIDPHSVYTYLRYLRGAEVTNSDQRGIPSGPDGQPPLQRFWRGHKALVSQLDAIPVAVSMAQWTQLVFRAAGGMELVRAFSPRELYPYFFPPTKRHKFEPCHADCTICRQYAEELSRWRPGDPFPEVGVPHHRGSLHTSRGAGPDGLLAELIRWVRPEDFREIYDYRMAVCTLLADSFNRWLSTSSVPDGDFAECVTTPLLKPVKSGQPLPPLWDDNSYRFITSSQLLAKAFSTVLASRLSHWAVRSGLLSIEQVAFQAFRGTEEHVFTVQQALRERARRRSPTYLLFCDFAKAYDTVHHGALWAVLELQGVPVQFIALLRDWASKRTTRVRVNGALSEPYAMEKGVPQGDPLSCMLFNLYIDSLSRYLKSRPDLQGISAFGGGISLLHLLYADDLIGFAENAAELQRILCYVENWSTAWGMKLNAGVGKTEAMLVDTEDQAPFPGALPLHLSDGRLVHWTSRYRYLGYYLRSDLRDDDAVGFLFSHLDYLWNCHFVHNGLVRHASATFQTQFYGTMVQGSLRHLRALTSISSSDAVKLDTKLLGHIRQIFNMKRTTPIDMESAVGTMLPWHAVHAQEHERLYLQLRESRYPQSIAARVFRLAQADPTMGVSLNKLNWVRAWERKRDELASLGVPLARVNLAYHLIPVAASKFGRAVAFVKWQAQGRDRNNITFASQRCDSSIPPSHIPKEAVADLFERFLAPISALGYHRAFTPFSTHGPGCSGSVPSRSNIAAPRLGPIFWCRTGAAAMKSPLFDLGQKDHAASAVPCALCPGPTLLDAFHLMTECSHPQLESWRRNCIQSLRGLVLKLTDVMLAERDRANRISDELLFDRATAAVRRADFDSEQGDFLLYRFLVAQPWSERLAAPGMRAVRLFGRVFDSSGVFHRYERPVADVWCRWSRRWLWRLSFAWKAANAA